MTATHTLAARAVLGGMAAACSLALGLTKRFNGLSQQRFDVFATGTLLVSRLSLYLLVFVGLRIPPRGDIPVFYRPEALAVLAGKLPYRDFLSSYAPLHPFLDGAVLGIWNSPLALVLFAIFVEAIAFPRFLQLARYAFEEDKVRLAGLLYLASPMSLQFVAIDGQDNVLIALLLVTAMLSLHRDRTLLSGISLGLAVVMVKFLPLLFAPMLLLASPRRGRWLAGFGGILALGYLPFAALRLPLLYPLQAEGQAKTASDLPFLLEALFGWSLPNRVSDTVLLLVLLGTLLMVGLSMRGAAAQQRLSVGIAGSVAMTLALLLLSKKSWPPYLMLILFPLCLMVASSRFSRLRLVAFAGFSWVAILAHSVWATRFLQIEGPDLHRYLAAGEGRSFGFLALQMVLLAGYAWWLAVALKRIGAPVFLRRSNPRSTPLVPSCAR